MALLVKNLLANARDVRNSGLISGLGRSHGGGFDNPLQYSCLEDPIVRGAWQATVHGFRVGHDRTGLAFMHVCVCIYIYKIHTQIYIYICIHKTHTYIHMYIPTYRYVCIWLPRCC